MVDLIAAKRSGEEHTPEQLRFVIQGITSGEIPDYQTAAWLMAVAVRGMTVAEVAALTLLMAESGERLNLQQRWPNCVDKHSTGGVGDKTSLVLMPMLAASGYPAGKMSGRGLGFSGGTIDKLESIPGLRCELSRAEFLDQLDHLGLVIASQSADLAPADGKLYALRDVTATVDSIPLIAASIMSKKLACLPGRLVLDVKTGRGAFMKTEAEARELAELMIAIGEAGGMRTSAVISDMDQPEGYAIGNALEVREAIGALQGEGPGDLIELCSILAAGLGVDDAERTLSDGSALAAFQHMIAAQGGEGRVVEDLSRLPAARCRRLYRAPAGGTVQAIAAERIGRAAVLLGAGRLTKGQPIDPAAGVVLLAKIGDHLAAGEPLAELHAASEARLDQGEPLLAQAFTLSEDGAPAAGGRIARAIIAPS